MKVLYITLENLSLHKGSVVHIKEIITGLQRLGHQVGLVAISSKQIENANHFYNLSVMTPLMLRLFKLKKQPYIVSSIFLFIYLLRILRQHDIIYARDFHTVIIARLPGLIFKKRLVFEINGIANEEQKLKGYSILNRILIALIKKLENMATRYSDRIVSVTPQIAAYLTRYFYCNSEKIRVISNGVNTKNFYPIHDEKLLASWRKRLGINNKDIVVAFVGNLAPWQGVENLIRMTPSLIKKVENIRFLIIGDGILKNKFIEQVSHLEISNIFIFTGMVDYQQIPLYINIADICVLPKRKLRSGYSPLKLYEYMACGKPIIASRVEGLEFIESDGAGLVTDPEDIQNLEIKLLELIKDSQRRRNMGQKAFEIAHNRFSWESKATEIEKMLKELA